MSVLAPAAFRAALDGLAQAFAQTHGLKVGIVYGPAGGPSAQSITSRLAQGYPADVVLLPGPMLDEQIRLGHLVAGRTEVLCSGIGACVRAGTPVPDISTRDALTLALLRAPRIAYSAAGSGDYVSGVLFDELGIADQVRPKAQRITDEPVAAVVARGEADLGFQQLSELKTIEGAVIAGPLPPGLQRFTVVAAGLTRADGVRAEIARRWITHLRSPGAVPLLVDAGVEPIAMR